MPNQIDADVPDDPISTNADQGSISEVPFSGIIGICAAGACYPATVLVFAAIPILVNDPAAFPSLVAAFVFCVTIGAFTGAMLAGASGVVCVLFVATLAESWGWKGGYRTLVAITGGLSGFLATCVLLSTSPIEFSAVAFVIVGLIFLAMLLGQIGSVWWASRMGFFVDATVVSHFDRSHQFHIRHIFVVMTVFASVLALGRAVSMRIPLALLLYIGMQLMLLMVDQIWGQFRSYSKLNAEG